MKLTSSPSTILVIFVGTLAAIGLTRGITLLLMVVATFAFARLGSRSRSRHV